MMTVNEWLTGIELPSADVIELGLERVAAVANKLELTRFDCPVITVGGTNGKGSCVKFLESILHCADYRVGTYTSPHLLRFNERIRVDDREITDEELCQSFKAIADAREDVSLTYFEFTTLAALWFFKQHRLNAVILEVGLGGRLDAVNIVDPDIAIITSIDLDHTAILGQTREEIAVEKAGILRPLKVAICGEIDPPTSLLHQAINLNCELYMLDRDFGYQLTADGWSWYQTDTSINLPHPQLPIQNAAIALMAISVLKRTINIIDSAIYEGIKKASLAGRWQRFEKPYPCTLDVAHNPASARLLAQKIRKEKSYIAVVAMLADKDIANTLQPLLPYVKQWHVASLSVTRGAKATQLADCLTTFGKCDCYTHDNVAEALLAATRQLQPGDQILVFGSFYTVAETLIFLQNSHGKNEMRKFM